MKTRLAKFIADSGIASRREAEKLITDGKVTVNGEQILTPVFFVDGSENVVVNGGQVASRITHHASRLFAFHKPINTLCTRSDPQGRATIYDVLPADMKNLKYIGRLDYKTTGLLLLTDDGDLARKLTLPESGIERVYEAKLHVTHDAGFVAQVSSHNSNNSEASRHPSSLRRAGTGASRKLREFLSPLSADDSIFNPLRRGVTIDGIRYAPMKIDLISRYPLSVRIVLIEGKKNEIRIAFDYIGLPIAKLRRVSYGGIELGDLPISATRKLSESEIKTLT
jgi:23S rRNA pseudouridine2605 synthase